MHDDAAVEGWFGGEPWPPGSGHPRPLNRDFYITLRQDLRRMRAAEHQRLDLLRGHAVELEAGDAVLLRLADGPQIVNAWAYNTHDCDERLWVQDMCLIEGVFLTRYSRLWGEMPRYRPLLTMVEDTVTPQRCGDPVGGQHHFLFGGGGTPANWRAGGGAPGVRTTYEQFVDVLDERGVPRELLTDNVCLFQKTAIDAAAQDFVVLPSDAVAGDLVTLFAEIDVTLVLALSPYVDGARTPAEIGDPRPRAVELQIFKEVATPLGWPYPGMPYPDLSLYLDDRGQRSHEPAPTDPRAYAREARWQTAER